MGHRQSGQLDGDSTQMASKMAASRAVLVSFTSEDGELAGNLGRSRERIASGFIVRR